MIRFCRRHPGHELKEDTLGIARICAACKLDDRRELPRVLLPGYVQAIAVLSQDVEARRETRNV